MNSKPIINARTRNHCVSKPTRLAGGGIIFLLVAMNCNLLNVPATPSPTLQSQTTEAPIPTALIEPTQPPEPTSAPQPTQPPAATDTPFAVFSLQRLSAVVSAGASNPLSEVQEDGPLPFPEGSFVNVNKSGEALLQGKVEGSQCKIFIFFDTRLQKKACEKSTFTGSNVSCIEEGSAIFDRCSNMLVQTPTAEFQLKGTWVLATYLSREQLTVLEVSDGLVEAHPVTDASTYATGEAVEVGSGQFLYTAPDNMISQDQVPGLAMRQALVWDQLSPLVQQYNLKRWYNRARQHAGEASVPFPDQTQVSGLPDLIITLEARTMTKDDRAIMAQNPNSIGVPVRATVVNQGGTPADVFKVSVDGTGTDGTYVRAFTVPGQQDLFYPHTAKPLKPDESVVFDGVVFFPSNQAGQQLTMVATADSCSGQEFAPPECAVAESNEDNNKSEPLTVTAPGTLDGPVP